MYIAGLQPIHITHSSTLSVLVDKGGSITMKVFDIEGRIAKTFNTLVEEGKQDLALNLSDLRNGVYVLNAFCGGIFLKSIRFIKE